VQRIERGGLPPDLALQPARGRRKVALELGTERVTLGAQFDDAVPLIGHVSHLPPPLAPLASSRRRPLAPLASFASASIHRARGRRVRSLRAAGSSAIAVRASPRSGSWKRIARNPRAFAST